VEEEEEKKEEREEREERGEREGREGRREGEKRKKAAEVLQGEREIRRDTPVQGRDEAAGVRAADNYAYGHAVAPAR
jgi:hypothetical protein